jgi:twinkle protein
MEKSDFMYHAPCSECQSRDNVAVYTDGHGHCFGCGHYYHNYEHKEETKLETQLIKGEHKPLNKITRQFKLQTTMTNIIN